MRDIFVFDTNSLISAVLISTSVSRKALDKAIVSGELAISKATFDELIEVIFRKKFDDEKNSRTKLNEFKSQQSVNKFFLKGTPIFF